MKTWMYFALFASLLCTHGWTQSLEREVVSPAGNFISAEGISLSWTLGQQAVQTASPADLVVTEGFQQGSLAVEPIFVKGKTGETLESLECLVYPNPASIAISIQILEPIDGAANVTLMTLRGEILLKEDISQKADLDISGLVQGMYILQVTGAEGMRASTYKIIKM